MAKEFTLGKNQRIKSESVISSLFEGGNTQANGILTSKYIYSKESINKAAFTVPKRSFKKAVHRNYIKRLMREAFRLNRPILEEKGIFIEILFIYRAKNIPNFAEIQKAILGIIVKINANSTISQ